MEVEYLKTVQKRPINDHDYDSLSLEVACAGNMRKNMPLICGICGIYVAYMHCIFSRIFCIKKFCIF